MNLASCGKSKTHVKHNNYRLVLPRKGSVDETRFTIVLLYCNIENYQQIISLKALD